MRWSVVVGSLLVLILAAPARGASFDYDGFSESSQGLTFNGSAAITAPSLQVVPAASLVRGSAFRTNPDVDPAKTFTTQFRLHVRDALGSPGDGMAFVIQSDPRGANALGAFGGNLGVYEDPGDGAVDGITPSVAIEFDNYDNSGNGIEELAADHVGVHLNGDRTDAVGLAALPAPLYGSEWYVWVDHDASVKELRIYVSQSSTKPGAALLTVPVDLAAVLGGPARIGFTAATGGNFAVHEVDSWRFDDSGCFAYSNATWSASGGGAWTTASNWSTGVVPDACTDVRIPPDGAGGARAISGVPAAAVVRSLEVGPGVALEGADLTVGGNLTWSTDPVFPPSVLSTDLQVLGWSSFDGGGTTQVQDVLILNTSSFGNRGSRLELTDARVDFNGLTLVNGPALEVIPTDSSYTTLSHVLLAQTGGLLGPGNVRLTGRVDVAGGGELISIQDSQIRLDGAQVTMAAGSRLAGASQIRVINGAKLTVDGAVRLDQSADVRLENGTLAGNGSFINGPGIFRWLGGTIDGRLTWGPGTVLSVEGGAPRTVTAGSAITVAGDAVWNSAAVVNFESPSVPVAISGKLSGAGSLAGHLINTGLVAPAGTISVASFTQSATGVLDLDVAETPDRLAVAGLATLDGTLALHHTPGYEPAAGTLLDVLTHGSRTGAFGALTGAAIDGDRSYALEYGDSGALALRVVSATPPPPPPPPPPPEPSPTATPTPTPAPTPEPLTDVIVDGASRLVEQVGDVTVDLTPFAKGTESLLADAVTYGRPVKLRPSTETDVRLEESVDMRPRAPVTVAKGEVVKIELAQPVTAPLGERATVGRIKVGRENEVTIPSGASVTFTALEAGTIPRGGRIAVDPAAKLKIGRGVPLTFTPAREIPAGRPITSGHPAVLDHAVKLRPGDLPVGVADCDPRSVSACIVRVSGEVRQVVSRGTRPLDRVREVKITILPGKAEALVVKLPARTLDALRKRRRLEISLVTRSGRGTKRFKLKLGRRG